MNIYMAADSDIYANIDGYGCGHKNGDDADRARHWGGHWGGH